MINIALSKIAIDFILSKVNVDHVEKFNVVVYTVKSSIFELQKFFLISVFELQKFFLVSNRKFFFIQTIKITFTIIDVNDFDEKLFANNFFEIVFFNDVTIHQSNVIQFFVNIIDEFFAL